MTSPSSASRLDELRALHPELGFGVFALEPNGVVTLEVYTPDGLTYAFKDVTEAAALARAFPPTEPDPPQQEPAPEPPGLFD